MWQKFSIDVQCFRIYKNNPCADILVPHKIREQAVAKQGVHIKKQWLVDNMQYNGKIRAPVTEIKFQYDQKATTYLDGIQDADETDIAKIPTSDNVNNEQTK